MSSPIRPYDIDISLAGNNPVFKFTPHSPFPKIPGRTSSINVKIEELKKIHLTTGEDIFVNEKSFNSKILAVLEKGKSKAALFQQTHELVLGLLKQDSNESTIKSILKIGLELDQANEEVMQLSTGKKPLESNSKLLEQLLKTINNLEKAINSLGIDKESASRIDPLKKQLNAIRTQLKPLLWPHEQLRKFDMLEKYTESLFTAIQDPTYTSLSDSDEKTLRSMIDILAELSAFVEIIPDERKLLAKELKYSLQTIESKLLSIAKLSAIAYAKNLSSRAAGQVGKAFSLAAKAAAEMHAEGRTVAPRGDSAQMVYILPDLDVTFKKSSLSAEREEQVIQHLTHLMAPEAVLSSFIFRDISPKRLGIESTADDLAKKRGFSSVSPLIATVHDKEFKRNLSTHTVNASMMNLASQFLDASDNYQKYSKYKFVCEENGVSQKLSFEAVKKLYWSGKDLKNIRIKIEDGKPHLLRTFEKYCAAYPEFVKALNFHVTDPKSGEPLFTFVPDLNDYELTKEAFDILKSTPWHYIDPNEGEKTVSFEELQKLWASGEIIQDTPISQYFPPIPVEKVIPNLYDMGFWYVQDAMGDWINMDPKYFYKLRPGTLVLQRVNSVPAFQYRSPPIIAALNASIDLKKCYEESERETWQYLDTKTSAWVTVSFKELQIAWLKDEISVDTQVRRINKEFKFIDISAEILHSLDKWSYRRADGQWIVADTAQVEKLVAGGQLPKDTLLRPLKANAAIGIAIDMNKFEPSIPLKKINNGRLLRSLDCSWKFITPQIYQHKFDFPTLQLERIAAKPYVDMQILNTCPENYLDFYLNLLSPDSELALILTGKQQLLDLHDLNIGLKAPITPEEFEKLTKIYGDLNKAAKELAASGVVDPELQKAFQPAELVFFDTDLSLGESNELQTIRLRFSDGQEAIEQFIPIRSAFFGYTCRDKPLQQKTIDALLQKAADRRKATRDWIDGRENPLRQLVKKQATLDEYIQEVIGRKKHQEYSLSFSRNTIKHNLVTNEMPKKQFISDVAVLSGNKKLWDFLEDEVTSYVLTQNDVVSKNQDVIWDRIAKIYKKFSVDELKKINRGVDILKAGTKLKVPSRYSAPLNAETPQSLALRKRLAGQLFPKISPLQRDSLLERDQRLTDYLSKYQELQKMQFALDSSAFSDEKKIKERYTYLINNLVKVIDFLEFTPLTSIDKNRYLTLFKQSLETIRSLDPDDIDIKILTEQYRKAEETGVALKKACEPTYFNAMKVMYPLLADQDLLLQKMKVDLDLIGVIIGTYTFPLKWLIDAAKECANSLADPAERNELLTFAESFEKRVNSITHPARLMTAITTYSRAITENILREVVGLPHKSIP